jgi:hypothetical protein
MCFCLLYSNQGASLAYTVLPPLYLGMAPREIKNAKILQISANIFAIPGDRVPRAWS